MRNRTRISSLDAFGLRDQRNRIYPALEASDGSTLSLDFTQMSRLDSRFTFTRASTATFINSSGLVQFADHNLVVNSTFGSLATPQGWTGSTGVSLTTPSVGVRRAVTTTAAENWIATSNIPTSVGLTYSTSVYVTDVSGQHYANTAIITASPTSVAYYRNGVSVGQFATAQPGLITITWTASTTVGHSLRVGVGCTGATVANAVCEFTEPRTSRGTNAQPTYFANTSTSDPYQAPRFDHDPTTLAPRGLLIEAGATNLLQYSEDYSNAYWSKSNSTIDTTSVTCPDNIARTTVRVKDNATNGQHSIRRSFATTNGTTYTLSFWVKKGSTNSFAVLVYADGTFNTTLSVTDIDNNTQTVTGGTGVNGSATRVTYPNGWYRYAFTFTAVTANPPDINLHPKNASVYVGTGDHTDFFGIQLETGSGASSYIPTGASTVQRAAESCSMTGSNFSSWYGSPTAFTVVFEGTVVSAGNYARMLNFSSGANTTATFPDFNVGVPSAASNRPFANSYIASINNVDIYVPLSGAVTNGVAFKFAARCQAALHRITRGTGLAATSNYNGFPAGLANLYFGGSNGVYNVSVHYARVKFFPIGIPDAQMDTLAT